MSDRVVLISGATGQQGGATARALAGKGFTIRALTRKPDSDAARALAASGAQIVKGDLDDPASLKAALAGAWGAYGVQNTWEAGVEKEEEQGKRFATIAQGSRRPALRLRLGGLGAPRDRHPALRQQVPRRGHGAGPRLPVHRHHPPGLLHGEPGEPVVPARRHPARRARADDEAADDRGGGHRPVRRPRVHQRRRAERARDRHRRRRGDDARGGRGAVGGPRPRRSSSCRFRSRRSARTARTSR